MSETEKFDHTAAEGGDLEALFSEAREAAQAPLGAAFSARLLADAQAVQGIAPAPSAPKARGSNWLREVWAGFGGWGALAGLTAATVTGVWIGGVSPAWIDGVPGIDLSLSDAEVLEDDAVLDLLFPVFGDGFEGI